MARAGRIEYFRVSGLERDRVIERVLLFVPDFFHSSLRPLRFDVDYFRRNHRYEFINVEPKDFFRQIVDRNTGCVDTNRSSIWMPPAPDCSRWFVSLGPSLDIQFLPGSRHRCR